MWPPRSGPQVESGMLSCSCPSHLHDHLDLCDAGGAQFNSTMYSLSPAPTSGLGMVRGGEAGVARSQLSQWMQPQVLDLWVPYWVVLFFVVLKEAFACPLVTATTFLICVVDRKTQHPATGPQISFLNRAYFCWWLTLVPLPTAQSFVSPMPEWTGQVTWARSRLPPPSTPVDLGTHHISGCCPWGKSPTGSEVRVVLRTPPLVTQNTISFTQFPRHFPTHSPPQAWAVSRTFCEELQCWIIVVLFLHFELQIKLLYHFWTYIPILHLVLFSCIAIILLITSSCLDFFVYRLKQEIIWVLIKK